MQLPREAVPERFRPAIEACATGEVPPNVGLLRLLIEAGSAEEVGGTLRAASQAANNADARSRLAAAQRLFDENPQAFALVKTVLQGVEHGGTAEDATEGVRHWAAAFERMAKASPEGSVALYALGNPELLRTATDEVTQYLRGNGLVRPQSRVLEIGCGVGRFVEALAPEVAAVTGLDIAPRMIEEARRRCASLPNVRLVVSSGRDLSPVTDESTDLVLAADVFPYLVQVGFSIVEDHIREIARVLAAGGSLVILNFSYRGKLDRDLQDVRALAERHDLVVVEAGERPFSWWDASVFQLSKKR